MTSNLRMSVARVIGPTVSAREMPLGLYAGVLLSALVELLWAASALLSLGDTPAHPANGHLDVGQVQLPLNSVPSWTLLAVMVAVTWGCRSGRDWARYAAAAFWMLPVAARSTPASAEGWMELVYALAIAACAVAYLFRNAAVAAYFTRAKLLRAGHGGE